MTEPELALAADGPRARPWVTWALCAAVVAIWLSVWASGNDSPRGRGWLPAHLIWQGRPWALVTAAFVHVGVFHLAFNLYWMWVLGRQVERLLGPARLVAFVLAAAMVGSAAELAVADDTGIGFSDVGYAMFGLAWVVSLHRPELGIRISRETARAFGIWLLFGIFAGALELVNFGNAAHLAGGLFGLCAGFMFTERWKVAGRGTLGTLLACSVLIAFWAPWSPAWTMARAIAAYERGDGAASLRWLEESERKGQDAAWVTSVRAYAHARTGERDAVRHDVEVLRKLDPERAERVAAALHAQ